MFTLTTPTQYMLEVIANAKKKKKGLHKGKEEIKLFLFTESRKWHEIYKEGPRT